MTFDAGSNANNITKDAVTTYSLSGQYVSSATSKNFSGFNTLSTIFYTGVEVQQAYAQVAESYTTSSTSAYTANLIFNGSNTVSGSTDIDAGNIRINGGASFAGTVQAGSIDVYTPDTITFTSHVDLSPGTTDALTFYNAGDVRLNSGLTGNIDFNGQDSIVTLGNGNINGYVKTSTSGSGTLKFTTSNMSTVSGNIGSTANLKEIIIGGTGFIDVNGAVKTNLVTFNSAGTLQVNSLDTTLTDASLGTVNFGNYNGTFEIDGGNLIGNVITNVNNNGTVTMMSGNQIITGDIGTSSKKIATLNIGGTNFSSTTAYGNIFATNTVLNTGVSQVDSSLTMAQDYNITSAITTSQHGYGILTLAGGTQTVTGTVGTDIKRLAQVNSGATSANSTFTGNVYAIDVNNTGTGTSNFQGNVVATTINVNSGTSNFAADANSTTTNITSGTANFASNVNATTTTIGTGTGNFNTLGGTTTSAIVFNDVGTANLHTGLTGTVAFAGKNATVNVWDGKAITGAISTTANNTGILNYRGDGTISSTVGATGLAINELNINTNSEQNATTSVLASGNIFANTINLKNNGTLTLANDVNITTTNVTTDINNTGALKILGTSVINGIVGASDKVIATINAGVTNAITTFNGMVYATKLNYDGNGTVILNGKNGAIGGLVGTVDFNGNTARLEIGNDVNLTTGLAGIQFLDTNNSTLAFDGNSTVIGAVGTATDRFKTITAGVNNSTVTFNHDVYVSETALTTLDVIGTGTVNLEGNLYGDLLYKADGIVNVSNGKSIVVTTAPLAVSTDANNTGTLNYLGSTTLSGDIGTTAYRLKAVNFNTASTGITQNIDKNIYAVDTRIGNETGTTIANITADKFLGNALTLVDSNVTLNTATPITSSNGVLAFDHTKNANGTLSVATITDSTTGTGAITTNGATLSFVVGSADYVANGTNGVKSDLLSSSITGGAGSTLVMNGSEKINVALLGSLSNGVAQTLINVASGSTGVQTATLTDNSFVIDTTLSRVNGDLVVTTSRDANSYVTKSNTSGHFSNNAAVVLGGLGATGLGYSEDMQTVLNKLDMNQDGYGNTQANLARQVQLLAPVVNNSITLSTMSSGTLALNSVSNRMSELKGISVASSSTSASASGLSAGDDSLSNGVWAKVIGTVGTQDKVGQYDGYKTNSYGMAIGVDKKLDTDMIIGLALGYTNSDIDQEDFRSGDTAKIKSYQLMAYASKEFGKAYVEGALAYGMHSADASRATAIARVAKASIDANQYSARLEGGYRVDLQNKLTLTPFASFDYAHLVQDAYTETGAGALNLNVDEITTDRSKLGLGLRIGSQWEQNAGKVQADLKLAAYQYLGTDNADVSAQFAGGGAKFITPGVSSDDTFYNVGLGVKYQMSKTTSLGVNVDYDRSSDGSFNGYSGSLIARKVF